MRGGLYWGRCVRMKENGKERKGGKVVRIRVIKNKVGGGRGRISKWGVYLKGKLDEVGFDRWYGLEDVLVDRDVMEKSSGGYKLKGKSVGRGEEKLEKVLEEEDEVGRKVLGKGGVNRIGSSKKEVEKIERNILGVDGVEYEKY